MNYLGTTREIRFGDAVQIVAAVQVHCRQWWIGRITAQATLGENVFFVKFGDGKELTFTTDQFQWVGSPKPAAEHQQKLRSQIRNRERMD